MRSGKPVACGIEASFAHTQCVLAAQQSGGQIVSFAPSSIKLVGAPGHRKTVVDCLSDTLTRCYHEAKLPSELNVEWAKPGKPVEIGAELSM